MRSFSLIGGGILEEGTGVWQEKSRYLLGFSQWSVVGGEFLVGGVVGGELAGAD